MAEIKYAKYFVKAQNSGSFDTIIIACRLKSDAELLLQHLNWSNLTCEILEVTEPEYNEVCLLPGEIQKYPL
jgi:hypothetical protein